MSPSCQYILATLAVFAATSSAMPTPHDPIIGGVIHQESAGNPNAISHGHGGGAGLMQINHRYRRNPPNPYAGHIQAAAGSYGVPHSIIGGIIHQESAGNPHAVSSSGYGSSGLMQVNHRYRRNPPHTAAATHGTPSNIIHSVVQQESAGNPSAGTSAGSPGLMQINHRHRRNPPHTHAEDIHAAAASHGAPSNIIAAVIQQESAGNPSAGSSQGHGSPGLMQVNHRHRRNLNNLAEKVIQTSAAMISLPASLLLQAAGYYEDPSAVSSTHNLGLKPIDPATHTSTKHH